MSSSCKPTSCPLSSASELFAVLLVAERAIDAGEFPEALTLLNSANELLEADANRPPAERILSDELATRAGTVIGDIAAKGFELASKTGMWDDMRGEWTVSGLIH